jgi:site-specific DNA recombinase
MSSGQLTDAQSPPPPPPPHSEMATFHRQQVSALREALQDDREATRLKAGEILRSLVEESIRPVKAALPNEACC